MCLDRAFKGKKLKTVSMFLVCNKTQSSGRQASPSLGMVSRPVNMGHIKYKIFTTTTMPISVSQSYRRQRGSLVSFHTSVLDPYSKDTSLNISGGMGPEY